MKQGPVWNFSLRVSSCSSRGLLGIHSSGGCLIQTRSDSTEHARQSDTQQYWWSSMKQSSAGLCSVSFTWQILFPWCCWDLKIVRSDLVLHLFFESKQFSPPYKEGWSCMVAGLLGLGDDKGWMSRLLCLYPLSFLFIWMIASRWASSGLLAVSDRLCSSPSAVFASKFL